jgi:MFS transporter, putative metabolite:H+ symporter
MDNAAQDLGTKIDSLKKIPLGAGVLIAISLSSFFTFYDITNYAYIAPVLKEIWGVGDGEIATGASATIIGYVIGAFSITVFADSYGRRPMLVASVLILGAGSIFAALSQDMAQMSSFRLLTGIGMGAEIAISTVYISELSPKSKRGKYTSGVVVLGWTGLALSGPISLALVQQVSVAGVEGWRIVMALPGIAALISLMLRIRMPESPRWLLSKGKTSELNSVLASLNIGQISGAGHVDVQKKRSDFRILRNRTVARRTVLLAAVWFLVLVPVYASLLLVVEFVNQGYSLTESISINVISSTGFVVGGILPIIIAERIERKYQIAAAGVIMAIGFIMRGFLVGEYGSLVVSGFIAFASNAWLVSNLYTYTAESFPTKMRSFGAGVVEGSGRALSALGPFIFVVLQPFGFLNLMTGISLFSFAAAAVVLAGPLTRGRSLENLNSEI